MDRVLALLSPIMSWALVFLAGAAATLFAMDLARRFARNRRAHTAAYGSGMFVFAIATWLLLAALTSGWTGFLFRGFYLLGAIVNVPLLALGSLYLVVGARWGRRATWLVAVFSLAAATVTVTAPFTSPLPVEGIPAGSDLFAFSGPRIWAALGSGLGAIAIILLAVWSAINCRKTAPHLFRANLLIVAGVMAAAWGGTGLALGREAGFALSLLTAAGLIWLGDRVATTAPRPSARRASTQKTPTT